MTQTLCVVWRQDIQTQVPAGLRSPRHIWQDPGNTSCTPVFGGVRGSGVPQAQLRRTSVDRACPPVQRLSASITGNTPQAAGPASDVPLPNLPLLQHCAPWAFPGTAGLIPQLRSSSSRKFRFWAQTCGWRKCRQGGSGAWQTWERIWCPAVSGCIP